MTVAIKRDYLSKSKNCMQENNTVIKTLESFRLGVLERARAVAVLAG